MQRTTIIIIIGSDPLILHSGDASSMDVEMDHVCDKFRIKDWWEWNNLGHHQSQGIYIVTNTIKKNVIFNEFQRKPIIGSRAYNRDLGPDVRLCVEMVRSGSIPQHAL